MGTIKSVQSSMGYIPARERTDTCAGCTYFEKIYPERSPPWDKPYSFCNKGGFKTNPMAVCKQHKPKEI